MKYKYAKLTHYFGSKVEGVQAFNLFSLWTPVLLQSSELYSKNENFRKSMPARSDIIDLSLRDALIFQR